MKLLKVALIIATVVSAIGFGAVRLGYIQADIIKAIIFISLVVSAVGDAVVAIWLLFRRTPNSDALLNEESKRELITTALDVACSRFSEVLPCKFRSNIFVKCPDDQRKLCINYYSSNMVGEPDRNIRLDKWQGCTGKAWGYRAPTVADLTLPEFEGGASWGLDAEQVDMTRNLAAILSVPVRHPKQSKSIIAILSFDTEEPIADELMKDRFKGMALQEAALIGLLLQQINQVDPLE